MLTRRFALLAALLAGLLLAAPAAAQEQDGDGLDGGSNKGKITVSTTYTSQQDGYDGRGGGPRVCNQHYRGADKEVPCTDATYGWWSNTFDCFMRPAGSASSAGVAPRAGMVLWNCYWRIDAGQWLTGLIWLPAEQGPGPDPATVIRDRAEATLPKPAIGITPPAGSGQPGLVGLPTWLWVAGGWSPVTITATAGPMWITATATVSSAGWTLGDGGSVTCGKGTPYSAGFGAEASPDCGHTYRDAGDYTITATLHWRVAWRTSDGRSGSISMDTASSTPHSVAQAYSVVTGQG